MVVQWIKDRFCVVAHLYCPGVEVMGVVHGVSCFVCGEGISVLVVEELGMLPEGGDGLWKVFRWGGSGYWSGCSRHRQSACLFASPSNRVPFQPSTTRVARGIGS
jgi:hypothetical protein